MAWQKSAAKVLSNMINRIKQEMRRSMNATPTEPCNKNQWQAAQEDPKQKQDMAQDRTRTI
jgi:hypothetical protein